MAKYIVLFFSALVVFLGLKAFLDLSTAPGTADKQHIFEVAAGAPFGIVAQQLQEKGLVRSALGIRIYARFSGLASQVKMGEYALHEGMSPRDILEVMVSGKSITHPITFPEGMNIYEMAKLVAEKGLGTEQEFLALVKNPEFVKRQIGEVQTSLEGYLFPETYNITKFTKLQSLVEKMVERFLDVYSEVARQGSTSFSRHQLVSLASVIEKETGAPEERPTISSVFYNRLQKGIKLQSDPTIMYGLLEERGSFVENITKSDILSPTKYNTYVIPGIPPGPISNPGREALLAALKPAATNYLYFVSRNDGTHVFTPTYELHLQAVQRFQMDPKARQGKSWRDRNKKPSGGPN